MREANFLELQNHFPHSQYILYTGLSAVNIETTFRVLTESVQRIKQKMDSFNVRMEMVEKSLGGIEIKLLYWCISQNNYLIHRHL